MKYFVVLPTALDTPSRTIKRTLTFINTLILYAPTQQCVGAYEIKAVWVGDLLSKKTPSHISYDSAHPHLHIIVLVRVRDILSKKYPHV